MRHIELHTMHLDVPKYTVVVTGQRNMIDFMKHPEAHDGENRSTRFNATLNSAVLKRSSQSISWDRRSPASCSFKMAMICSSVKRLCVLL
jgi:hypothetical protein